MFGVKRNEFSLVLFTFLVIGGRLWEASGIENVDFSPVSSFLEKRIDYGGVSGDQDLIFPKV